MIKFKGWDSKRGRDIVGFGLSEGNLERLRDGKPIEIDMQTMGLSPMTVLIFYGETEEKMQESLKHLIGPDTKVHIDPKLRNPE